jgi:hypothetical protein
MIKHIIPEDSALKRHFMTELYYKQEAIDEVDVVAKFNQSRVVEVAPICSKQVLLPMILFLFMMAVVFI